MAERFWNRQINRLERAGNDDFLLILTGGAGAYATHELHILLRRIRLQAIKLRKIREAMFRVGVVIPLLMFAACGAGLAGLHVVVYTCLLCIPGCLLLLIAMSWYVAGNFSCHDRAKRLRCIIQQELERRRKDVNWPG